MPAVLRCMFGLSASDIKAYVLNRHLKTLAGMNFRLTRHAGVKPLLLVNPAHQFDCRSTLEQGPWRSIVHAQSGTSASEVSQV